MKAVPTQPHHHTSLGHTLCAPAPLLVASGCANGAAHEAKTSTPPKPANIVTVKLDHYKPWCQNNHAM